MAPPARDARLPRLARLFAADGRCMVVGFDHGVCSEKSWLPALQDLERMIPTLAAAGPDGMTLAFASAPILQAIPDPHRPALLLRADMTNAYWTDRPTRMLARELPGAVERAVALDAAAVVAGIMSFPGRPELFDDCVRNVGSLRAACDPVGMPLMVEVISFTDNPGVPLVVTDTDEIATLARLAAELGADVIKADPPAAPEEFEAIVASGLGLPVVASGGIAAADDVILRRTVELVAAGADGIVYGRNVMWADDPVAMTRTLADVVHGRVSAEEALTALRQAPAPGRAE